MVTQALLIVFTSWVTSIIDTLLGWQTLSRPIICGSITGLVCGDFKTGIIMGGLLEAIYMGISGIGGVVPADSRNSTIISTALVILSGIDIESGIALAVPIGALITNTGVLSRAVSDALNPIFLKAVEKPDMGRTFSIMCWVWLLIFGPLLNSLIIFFAVAYGVDGVSVVVNGVPAFVVVGLRAAGGMMAAAGIGILTMTIWSKESAVFILLGFVLSKFVGLSTLVIAIVGFIFAYILFLNDLNLKELAESSKTDKEDELYG